MFEIFDKDQIEICSIRLYSTSKIAEITLLDIHNPF